MAGNSRTTMWAHGSLHRRMLLAVSLPFLAVVVLTAGTFLVRQHALETREASINSLENELAVERLLTATYEAHSAANGYAISGRSILLSEVSAALAERDEIETLLVDRLRQQEGRLWLARLLEALDRHDETLRALTSGPVSGVERRRLVMDSTSEERRIQRLATRLANNQDALHRRTRASADRLNAWITASGVLIGLVGAGGGLIAVWFLSRQVVRRLRRVQVNAERLATGQGLLPEPEGHDEIAALARTVEEAHAAIRAKDGLLDLTLEAGGMAIYELRPDGAIILRGEPDLLRPFSPDGPVVTTNIASFQKWLALDENEVFRLPDGEPTVRTISGGHRRLEIRSRMDASTEGAAAGTTVGVVTDVTAWAEAQEALRGAKEEAERANRSKDDFLSRMSHELRTPLNAVLGFAQLLEMDDLDEEQRESVEHILKGGRHLLALVNDVLDLARIESGRLSLSVEAIKLADVVEDAMVLARPLAREQQIDLRVLGEGTEVHALVDRLRMKQVLLNLLSNAIKYNQPDGSITVDWSIVDDCRVRVMITDTGMGISDEQQADLFLPFARSDKRTADINGTGLGLAVSHSLVAAMGGHLSLGRTSEAGSTFLVEVPQARDVSINLPSAGRTDITRESFRQLGDLSILHVEDNAANRRLVEELFRRAGGSIPLAAATGQDGLDVARSRRPDLILLDRHLPDMFGEEVLRELRADERTANIPVIIVSADAMSRSAATLLRAGAAAFVSKPIDAEEFWRTVTDVMTREEQT